MGKRLIFLAGVGVGYVLGARAGRERYEAIMRSVRELRERPELQEAAGVVTAQAGQIAEALAERARDVMSGWPPQGSTGMEPTSEPGAEAGGTPAPRDPQHSDPQHSGANIPSPDGRPGA